MAAAVQSAQQPQFPWEAPYLTGAFWDGFPDNAHHLARSTGKLITQSDFDKLPLDSEGDVKHKQAQLHDILELHIPDSNKPETLAPEEYRRWLTRVFLLSSLERELGRDAEAESRLRRAITAWEARRAADPERKDPITKDTASDLSALSNLAYLLNSRGRYAEAEIVARQALPLFYDKPELGRTSPQAMGNLRMLVAVVGRQGRFHEAMVLLEDGYERVEEMANGKFAKYVDEEREALDEVKTELEEWEVEGKGE
jgi:tetratricopeptide (TPR) repeat protein